MMMTSRENARPRLLALHVSFPEQQIVAAISNIDLSREAPAVTLCVQVELNPKKMYEHVFRPESPDSLLF
jgi:hypothetical protein